MTDAGSLRGRLLLWLALLLLLVLLASGLSAYWNGREVADTAYDRTLLASARAIADGLYEKDGTCAPTSPTWHWIPSPTTAPGGSSTRSTTSTDG